MTISTSTIAPSVYNRSRTKLWIRTGILAVFGCLFGWLLYRDIHSDVFQLSWALAIFLLLLPVGFWMRKWVPMQLHPHWQIITISFDRIYFGLIFFLVGVKMIAGFIPGLALLADVIMCTILGLMIGRLAGICLRIHTLKKSFKS